MLVKAKWNVKDSTGWHEAGEVFNTEDDLGNAVEKLEAPKKSEVSKTEPAAAPEHEAEKKPEPKPERPKSAPTRRKASVK